MSKRFRKGDLVEINWTDPTGTINERVESAKLAPCVTRGTVDQRKGKTLRLWTSMYTDGTGDYTTLNTGCIDSWRVLVRREDL